MKNRIMVILLVSFLSYNIYGQTGLGFQAIENAGKITIIGYTGNETNLTIPQVANGMPIVAIGDQAFKGKGLTGVAIPNGITTIGSEAFSNNQLTSITIPNSVTTIADSVFSNNQLTNITIPNNITTIESGAFSNNQLTSITIPNSVTAIGGGAFLSNPLTSITIGPNVQLNLSWEGGPFPGNFEDYYNGVTGTYIRASLGSHTWNINVFTF
jgi:hypothetical protein